MNKIIQKFGWTGSLLILIILISIITSVIIKQIREDTLNLSQVKEENNKIDDNEGSSIEKKRSQELTEKVEVYKFNNKEKLPDQVKDNEVKKSKQNDQNLIESDSKIKNDFDNNSGNSNSKDLSLQNRFNNKLERLKDERSKESSLDLKQDKSINDFNLKQKKSESSKELTKRRFYIDGSKNNPTVKNNSPEIDVFRVDNEGNYVIAGKTSPNTEVLILSNENEIGKTFSDRNGDFVIIGNLKKDANPKEITIKSSQIDTTNDFSKSTWLLSDDRFIILPNKSNVINDNKTQLAFKPTILKSNNKNAEIIQKTEGGNVNQINLDLISYNEIGDIVLTGRGRINNLIYVYLDEKFIISEAVNASGGWKIIISNILPGIYNLRIDEVNNNGNVQSRISLPFKRESINFLTNLVSGTITVQSGNSLWRIARRILGGGIRYTEIYEKNKNLIKNPDLIYPGQVFEIPN